ncbi:hypothetical protein SteCoe_7225 [Stentor coeruleus]|uniref:Uncharacterized protein n=1 Tax=Stentor coeruleus TaxID=5963 RepID=A0A1R2CN24_9CILI|nr:hypothetical protein SteCoe_7225 [Stentor coeruleus]
MDVLYKPPMDYEIECKMLEKNYVTCLHEKSIHDVNVPMNCRVERILWFMTDCPTRFTKFTTSSGIKQAHEKWHSGVYEGSDY